MKEIIFRQLFDINGASSTYTYFIADKKSKDAIIIDPVIENGERDLQIIKELGLKVKYILDTHIHADHVTGAGLLKNALDSRTVIGKNVDCSSYDIGIEDGQTLEFGTLTIEAISTPGHTDSCTSFLIENMIFTGDALLYRGCGRTDFQQGDARKLYNSVRNKIFDLPIETMVYPAHDYQGHMTSSIIEEKQFNKRLRDGISEEQFVEIMDSLNLSKPKKIDIAVPANLKCGLI